MVGKTGGALTAIVTHRALILAAGRGSRMGALTDTAPKCLTPLAGMPLLEWTLAALKGNGICELLTIGGWRHELLPPVVGPVRVNGRWAETNMVRSLLCASDWLAQAPTLVVYGDGAYGRLAIASALAPPAHDVVVPIDRHWHSLWARRFADPLADAESLTCEGGRLTSIGQRASRIDQIEGQFMGLLRITPAGWARVSAWLEAYEAVQGSAAVDQLDMTGLLQGLISHGLHVSYTDVHGGWVEIDSEADRVAVEASLNQPGFLHDFRR